MKKIILLFLMLFFSVSYAQKEMENTQTEEEIVAEIEKLNQPTIPLALSPKKAGWRSAILPGWGQYYNRKYWKIPIVWGAIGTGIGIIAWNQKGYKRYKNAFDAELRGETHEFSDIAGVDLKTALGNTQDARKRQRDYAIAITAGIYILNIVDAIVDAHLYEGRKDRDLAISPTIIEDFSSPEYSAKAGLALSFKF